MQNLNTLRQQQLEQRFSWPEAMSLMAPVIDTVNHLHCQRPAIIHGAITPTSIIIPKTGDEAILVEPGMHDKPAPGSMSGPVQFEPEANYRTYSGYRAPEQHSGILDTHTDIYALGATFYTLLTGIVPPDGLTRQRQLANERIDPLQPIQQVLPSIPAFIAEPIHQAMALDAAHRFSSVEQLWETLWEAALNPDAIKPTFVPVPKSRPIRMYKLNNIDAIKPTPVPIRKSPESIERPTNYSISKFVILLIIVALLISLGIATGPGILHFASSQVHTSSHPHPIPPAAATAPLSTSEPIINPTSTKTYNGTIYDLTSNVSTSLSLSGMMQTQGKISGDLIIGPRMQGSGLFYGTIDATGHLQFTVRDATGQATLFFEGAVQSTTSLSGDYYSCTQPQGNHCTRSTGDYGIWSVSWPTS